MIKQRIEYGTVLDALVAITKRLSRIEERQGLSSEEFFYRYTHGITMDGAWVIEWANDYQHYLALRQELSKPSVFDVLMEAQSYNTTGV